jgi:5-formyltetrahydrofolate cyclo-ligase
MDAEVDLAEFVDSARATGRRIFLPVIMSPFLNHLRFAPYPDSCAFRRNRFGIPEPIVERWQLIGASGLDAVLMPLVGFDAAGTRIGMGGGFYDRTLAFRLHRAHWRKPVLIGVAFEVQRAPSLVRNPWDVPLDHVVTEAGWVV